MYHNMVNYNVFEFKKIEVSLYILHIFLMGSDRPHETMNFTKRHNGEKFIVQNMTSEFLKIINYLINNIKLYYYWTRSELLYLTIFILFFPILNKLMKSLALSIYFIKIVKI